MEFPILEKMFDGENPDSVFEIGCANGGLLADIKTKYPNLKVAGMDISRSIEGSKERFPEYAHCFFTGDINEPWLVKEKSVDIVFSVGVLMYQFDPILALQEMFRVAKDKVILAEYHHPAISAFGQLTEPYFGGNKIQMGIIRNYIPILKNLNIPMDIFVMDSGEGKTIIKCKITK